MRARHYALGGWLVVAGWAGCEGRTGAGNEMPAVLQDSVRPGLEVLLSDSLDLVRGRRVGLVTNQAGVDHRGVSGVDRLRAAPLTLVALFSPEHGFRGTAAPGESVATVVDSATGLPIYSLYGATSAPTPGMLAGLDLILVDLQDAGARYYTYLWTTVGVMRAAAESGIPVVVLDRPDPIGGQVQGNVLDTAWRSPVGLLALPMRHGMTLGELARLARHDLGLGTELHVIPAAGWRRSMYLDQTGLPFVPPSPNLRTLESLIHYPGICLFEGTSLSVGRGSDHPFEQVGAPGLDTSAVLRELRRSAVPGVAFQGVSFTPVAPGDAKFADTLLLGIRLRVTDRSRYDPTVAALALLDAVRPALAPGQRLFPGNTRHFLRLFGAMVGGPDGPEAVARWDRLAAAWVSERERFLARREPFLIYPE